MYYNEDPEKYDQRKAPHLRGTGERLLSREYWKGQMHGGTEHPVHARHMRPRLSSVPSSKIASSQSSELLETDCFKIFLGQPIQDRDPQQHHRGTL